MPRARPRQTRPGSIRYVDWDTADPKGRPLGSARRLDALEQPRHRVAEVRLDGRGGRLAVAALERVDDLGVLGHRLPDVARDRHVRKLVAQQPALERAQRAEQLLVVAVAHEL